MGYYKVEVLEKHENYEDGNIFITNDDEAFATFLFKILTEILLKDDYIIEIKIKYSKPKGGKK